METWKGSQFQLELDVYSEPTQQQSFAGTFLTPRLARPTLYRVLEVKGTAESVNTEQSLTELTVFFH